MSVRALLIFVCLYLHLFCGSVSSAYLSDGYLKDVKDTMRSYSIAKYIDDNYKERLHLEYKSLEDLYETVQIVDKYCKYDSNFKRSDIISIIIKESKFKQYAINKNDGGKGLGQITNLKKWHNEELFWVNDIYDKHQNIASIFILLNANKKAYGTKYQAFKRYNGSTYKSDIYAKSVTKLSNSISYINTI